MIRVLHLRSQNGDLQTEQTAALLQSETAGGFSVQTRRIGVGSDPRHPICVGWSLRREHFDILHAWDPAGLAAAAIAGNAPIIYSPSDFPNRQVIRWLHFITRFRDVQIVSANAAQQRAFEAAGFLPQRATLIRPGIKPITHTTSHRPALREALGLREDDHVILCPGESTRAANHELATWVAAILHVHDPRHKLLLWGRGPQAKKAARLSTRLHQPDLLRLAEIKLGRPIEFSQLTAAADTVLNADSGIAPTFSMAVCMAAGLPIVSVASAAILEFLQDSRNAIVPSTSSARSLAQSILEQVDSQARRNLICANAKRDSVLLFSSDRFLEQYWQLYGRLSGTIRVA